VVVTGGLEIGVVQHNNRLTHADFQNSESRVSDRSSRSILGKTNVKVQSTQKNGNGTASLVEATSIFQKPQN
jgi:hypothetical protein